MALPDVGHIAAVSRDGNDTTCWYWEEGDSSVSELWSIGSATAYRGVGCSIDRMRGLMYYGYGPGTAGTNNDVTASIKGNSTRVGIAATAFSAVGAAGGGGFQITTSNVCQITTSAQNSSGVTVTHFGIWDAATSGNFLASGSLTTNVDVQLGDTVQFNSAAMAIKVI